MCSTRRLQFALSFVCSVPVAAQCSTTWSSASPAPQLAGNAECSTLWDPDGVGPAPQRLVVGGDALVGGAAAAGQRVMSWDGAEWLSLGNGPGTAGKVTALTTWNGLLVAGGTFTGGGTDHVALWDGTTWQPLGGGVSLTVVALAQWSGNLAAVQSFMGTTLVSVWNGAAWSNLPTPSTLTTPRAMVSFDGYLCVGGHTSTGGGLARWDGTSWLPLIPANNWITCLSVRAFQFNSTLYVGGHFTNIGPGGTPANRVASTTGLTTPVWSAVGGGLPQPCIGLHTRATSAIGTTVVANLGSASPPLMQWTGTGSFAAMGSTQLSSISHYGGSYHGTAVGTSTAACLRYDGSAWVPVIGQGLVGEVRALARSGADMIVGGTIQSTTGTALNRIARWNGTTFQPLGTGIGGVSVDALLTLGNGDIVAGGLFTMAGGLSINNIARWNGSAWSGFGTGSDQQALALCSMPNGDIVAGGKFSTVGGVLCARIARWNGSAWTALGAGMNGDVMALAARSDGTLFAGGAFTTAGGIGCSRIAQWNGSAWLPVGTGMNGNVHGLAARPNGDVVAVGTFLSAGGFFAERCARWNGSTWAAMAASSGDTSIPRAVVALPDGDVVAGRGFHQPTATVDEGISRWDGSTWSGFDTGLVASVAGQPVGVRALAQRADGALIVGGDFGIAGGFVARGLARLSPTCPALVTPYGTGCSAAGPLAIVADTLPWLGASFRTTTTGVAPGSLCVGVIGLSPTSVPLNTLLPEGQPGCTLLAALDILFLLANGPGTAHSAFALADDPSLLGVAFFQQTVPLEFDGTGAITAIRSSHALAATIGTL